MTEPMLFVSTELNDDVFKGLRLYAKLTGEADEERADRWAKYFFRDNPLGNGLCISAKVEGQIVAFISLIDIEMKINGQAAKAAKVEFWATRPELLKLTVGDERLPWAIFLAIRREAAEHGYRVLQSVTRQGSWRLRKAGDLPVQTTFDRWSAPQLHANRHVRKLDQQLFRGYRMARMARTLRASAGGDTSTVRQVSRLAEPVASGYDNALTNSSEAMINRRFPDGSFMKLLLDRPNGLPCLFVFSRPKRYSPCTLLHTSDTPSLTEWAAISAVTLKETIKAKGSGLIIDLPTFFDQSLQDIGFCLTGQSQLTCFLYDVTGEGLQGDWHYTQAHTGLYRAIE